MFPLIVVAAGIVGTAFMTCVMWFIHRAGWANADMIRALGSLITRRYEKSLAPGLALHFTAGCCFAIPYLLIVRSVGTHSFLEIVAICVAIGVFHGAAMSFSRKFSSSLVNLSAMPSTVLIMSPSSAAVSSYQRIV